MPHLEELRFWKSAEALRAGHDEGAPAATGARDCFAGQRAQTGPPPSTSRRDFLTVAGFGVAAAAIGACSRGREQKAIPFLNKPEEVTPGVANWYATTCGGCQAGCSVLVKTRDGRPIKIEGNDLSTLFGGGTCAVGQATVLSLYDDERLKGPLWRGQPTSWVAIDARIESHLTKARANGRRIVLLSGTLLGPATRALVGEWTARPGFEHVTYDAVSLTALRQATRAAFGIDGLPHYRFGRARTIVGIDADFLGTWLSPVEFTHDYARRRRPESGPMSRHIHFESGVSLTGGNADRRVAIAPSDRALVALALFQRIARRAGRADVGDLSALPLDSGPLDAAADDLWQTRGESLVVSGADDVPSQMLVHATNALLGNVGTTVDLDHPSLQKQGDDDAFARLVADMDRGDVEVLFVHGVNPAYDYPEADRFIAALEKVPLTVAFADRLDETAARARAVCPDHHFLEAWGDAEPVQSFHSLAQPTIAPLFDTRSAQESLLKWLGRTPSFYEYLRTVWRQTLFPAQDRYATFDEFWDHSLHDGVFVQAPRASTARSFAGNWRDAASSILGDRLVAAGQTGTDRYELHLYETVALRDGAHANNPWLQELPDPVTKVTWGNYAVVAPGAASRLGVVTGDVVALDTGGGRLELPAYVQPGQSPGVVSVALGYGRTHVGRVGQHVGANAYPMVQQLPAGRRYYRTGVAIVRTGRIEALAATQTHFSMEGRSIVRQLPLASLPASAEAEPTERYPQPTSLWAERPAGAHRWGMAVDLNACTGCSACVTACQAENNVPVVGKDEVRRGREMHWIRIDRYYAGPEDAPETLTQPMMCQHCDHAPCEPVCPVLATVHSSDGINQQVYNRCIGTRYCENNCPYKVRRFNWFEYAANNRFAFHMNSPLGRMVLNPDVVVRSRGVMEKCSLCTQRIQAGKLAAELAGRPVADGDIKTACQQACPADAIVFGDLSDPDSRVSQLNRSRRRYRVLEELDTRPNVSYLMRVTNV